MFFRKPLFKDFFITALVVAFLHYLALKFYLYWTISWFDILMHFLGGFLIALIVIFILISYIKNFEDFKSHKLLLITLVVGLTLSVGLAWELWEVFVGFTDTLKDLGDTILDIIMDTVGAFFAVYYSRKYIWMKK